MDYVMECGGRMSARAGNVWECTCMLIIPSVISSVLYPVHKALITYRRIKGIPSTGTPGGIVTFTSCHYQTNSKVEKEKY